MSRYLAGTVALVALLFSGTSALAKGKNPVVELDTSMGKIKLELFAKKAPKSVANFLRYVRSGHYKGTIFHRVMSTFMIQGGGMTPDMREKRTKKPIRNEADNGLSNARGTLAMARTSAPHSATAQFFINVRNNKMLDHKSKTLRGWGYCVFGKVVAGMKTVDKIRLVSTTARKGHENVPVEPILIKNAKVLR